MQNHMQESLSQLPPKGIKSLLLRAYHFPSIKSLVRAMKNVISPPPRQERVRREAFTLKWFFNDWKEKGIWHDTELLVAESEDSVAIAFRGSDSPADLVTNSQTMEPVTHSAYFRNCSLGAVHRGMLNAYTRVDRGMLVRLERGGSNNEAGASSCVLTPFSQVFDRVFGDCTSRRNASSTTSGSVDGIHSCYVVDVPLAEILVTAIKTAITSGKRVLLSGHSLGGALATLLSLDLHWNHPSASSDPGQGVKVNSLWDKLGRKLFSDRPSPVSASKQWGNVHVYTFGEPEFADTLLQSTLASGSSEVGTFLEDRYKRLVSLSSAPQCKPDIVTGIASRIKGYLGKKNNRHRNRKSRSGRKKTDDSGRDVDKHDRIQLAQLSSSSCENCTTGSTHSTVTSVGLVTSSDIVSSAPQTTATAPNATHNNSPCEKTALETTHLSAPQFVCSGSADNSLAAHSMAHYLTGLTHLGKERDHLGWLITTDLKHKMAQDLGFRLENCSAVAAASGINGALLSFVC